MTKTLFQFGGKAALAAVLALGLANSAVAGTVKVYANNPDGDSFSGTTGSWLNPGLRGQPVDHASTSSPGWYYNEVTPNSTIGITGDYKRNGNGSVLFEGVNGTSKAQISFFNSATLTREPLVIGNYRIYTATSALGTLGELTDLAFDWLRASGGTAPGIAAPVIRVGIASGSDIGYLIWEANYNGFGDVARDTWIETDAIGGQFWASPALRGSDPFELKSLSDWIDVYGANALVTEINVGFGSGTSGTFTAAADNITFGFNGNATTYNFETAAIPEPGSIVMGLIAGGLGLAGAAWRRRRVD